MFRKSCWDIFRFRFLSDFNCIMLVVLGNIIQFPIVLKFSTDGASSLMSARWVLRQNQSKRVKFCRRTDLNWATGQTGFLGAWLPFNCLGCLFFLLIYIALLIIRLAVLKIVLEIFNSNIFMHGEARGGSYHKCTFTDNLNSRSKSYRWYARIFLFNGSIFNIL